MAQRRKGLGLALSTTVAVWIGFVALSPVLPEPRAIHAGTGGFHPLGLTPLGTDLSWTLLVAVARAHAHAFAGLAVAFAVAIALPLGLVAGLRRGSLAPASNCGPDGYSIASASSC